jgi:hypothetical protein
MSRTSKSLIAIALAALVLAALSGCQSPVAGGDSVGAGGSTPGSSTTSAAKTLPAGLPSDLPVFKGTVVSSAKTKAGSVTNFSFSVDTPEAVNAVSDWYRTHLGSSGWTITGSYTKPQAGGSFTMIAAKKGSAQANIAVGTTQGVTHVVCTVAVKG